MTQSQTEQQPLYLDDREIAKRTGLSRSLLQQMRVKQKGPPYYRVGKRCLYLWSDVVVWLDAQRVSGGGK